MEISRTKSPGNRKLSAFAKHWKRIDVLCDIVIESLDSVVGMLRIGFAVILSLVVKLC